MRQVLAAGALSLMTLGAAHSADYAEMTPAAVWTGFYAGLHVGYVSGEVDAPAAFPASLDPNGFFAGVQAGYNHQLVNDIVLGAWLSVPVAFADDSAPAFGGVFDAELNWVVAAGGRVGYALDNILPFVFAGVAFGEGTGTATFGGVTLFNLSETHFGFTVGAGVDYRVHENWAVGFRYAYLNMADETYAFATPASVGFESHSVSATFNYLFNAN